MTREEAINEIKSWAIPSERGREVLKTLIPELVESEDERIRRELIEFIRWSEDRGMTRHDFHQAKRPSEWIAYLEKQKDSDMEFHEGYTLGFSDGVKSVEQKEPHYTKRNALFDKCVENCDPAVTKKVSDEVDEMLKKEQKEETLRNFIDDFPYSDQKEQKPVEFTHHETNESLKDAVTHQMEDDGDVDDFVRRGIDDIALKYAELGVRWQKEQKPEWSDEDERKLQKCIKIVERWEEDYDIAYAPYSGMLKSLRPHWKPSEEQMEALNSLLCIGDFSYVGQATKLQELYIELKKL